MLLNAILTVLVVAFLGYGTILFYFYSQQDRLLYGGLSLPEPSTPFTNTIQGATFPLQGWILNPSQEDAIIFFGGNNMPLEPMHDIFDACINQTVYLFPYEGFQGQQGSPSEASFINDGVAIVQAAQRQHKGRITIIGVSLGSGVAVQVAHRVKVDSVLLITPYDSILNVARSLYPWLPVKLLLRDHFDSAKVASSVKEPVFVLRSAYDQVIPNASTDRLIKAFNRPIDAEWIPTVHNGIWDAKHVEQTCEFIRKHVATSKQD